MWRLVANRLIFVITLLSVGVSSLLESYEPQKVQTKVERLEELQNIQAEAERWEEEQEDMLLLNCLNCKRLQTSTLMSSYNTKIFS